MTSLKTVGDENLPNLFIDKIYVYHLAGLEKNVKKIKVFLSAFDHRDTPSWFGRPELADMKIKVALVSHQPLVESLNNGTSLVDIQVPSLFDPDRLLHTPPYQAFYKRESFNPVLTEELGDFIKYIYVFEFEIEPLQAAPSVVGPSPMRLINDLNLYCCFYMDGFGFNVPQFDKYYGPMDGEIIYSGGEINQQSGYFYYPDTNEEYSGPVHAHEGIYMEGSVHSDSPHKEVKYVKINNLKIKLIPLDAETLLNTSTLTPSYQADAHSPYRGGLRLNIETDSDQSQFGAPSFVGTFYQPGGAGFREYLGTREAVIDMIPFSPSYQADAHSPYRGGLRFDPLTYDE